MTSRAYVVYASLRTINIQSSRNISSDIPHKITGKDTIVQPQEDVGKESKVVENIM